MVASSTTKEIGGSAGTYRGRSKLKKTRFQIQQLINEIGKMLSDGRPDREIMEELQIKRSQYYEYKSKLLQQSADLFKRLNEQNENSLIYHKELLSERLTRLYKQAESDLTQNTNTEGGNNKASTYLAAQNIAINIFKLEIEGLHVLANGQGRQMRGLPTYTGRRGGDIVPIQNGTGTRTMASNKNTEYDESEIS